MDVISAAVVSGAVYDLFKMGIGLTVSGLKDRLQKWIVDDSCIEKLAKELNELGLNDELSEKSIERKIEQSGELMSILTDIKATAPTVSIHQTHSGSGDNVGRDKNNY